MAGRYEVGRRIGRGGLGVVHAGWDPRLRRNVALKFVRPDRSSGDGDSAWQARLRREARTLAQLDHPAVVRVLDFGEASGQLYIAMELLDGTTLRAWAAAQQSRTIVLTACIDAAHGLAAAHRSGVIHRDFKPDNVVVTSAGRVVVVDFGLARGAAEAPPTDREPGVSTGPSTLAGTRGYIAPEVLAGEEASEASDQYAWCVTCSDLVPSPPAWLRDVLRRGLHPDPRRRFASMNELVAAVTRRPRRLLRFGVAVLATVPFVAGAWWVGSAVREHRRVALCEDAGHAIDDVWNDDARASVRSGILATAVPYAEATLESILPWVDQRAEEWKQTRIDACMHADGPDAWPQSTIDRSAWCFEERRIHLEAIVDALARADANFVQHAVALSGDVPPATPCGRPEILATLPPPPVAIDHDELRSSLAELARAQALDAAGRHDDAVTVAALVAERSMASSWPPLEVLARLRSGRARSRAGDLEGARAELEKAYFQAEALAWHAAAARAAIGMIAIQAPDQLDRALAWSRNAESSLANAPDDDGLAEVDRLSALAMAYRAAGDLERTRALFTSALEVSERHFGAEHFVTAVVLSKLAATLHERGDVAEARPLLERALALTERHVGPDHPRTAALLNNLAVSYVVTGDFAGARPLHERALAIRERAFGPDHPEVANSLNNLANVHTGLGEPEQALQLMLRAVQIGERRLGPDHPEVASMVFNLGNIELRQEHWEQARRSHERALVSREHVLGRAHPHTAASIHSMGLVYAGLGDLDAAERRQREAIAAYEESLGVDDPALADPLMALAIVELDRHHASVALPLARRALALRERGQIEPGRIADTEFVVARALWDSGEDREGARELARRARTALADAGGAWAPTLAQVDAWLASH